MTPQESGCPARFWRRSRPDRARMRAFAPERPAHPFERDVRSPGVAGDGAGIAGAAPGVCAIGRAARASVQPPGGVVLRPPSPATRARPLAPEGVALGRFARLLARKFGIPQSPGAPPSSSGAPGRDDPIGILARIGTILKLARPSAEVCGGDGAPAAGLPSGGAEGRGIGARASRAGSVRSSWPDEFLAVEGRLLWLQSRGWRCRGC